MASDVSSPKFQDVDVQNPTIQGAIRNMVKAGADNREIVKRIGMPHEVVNSVRKRMESEEKGR